MGFEPGNEGLIPSAATKEKKEGEYGKKSI
jgi:hypothetical protein